MHTDFENNLIQKAFDFAKNKHKDHFDDANKPYIFHLIQTYNLLKIVCPQDINLQCAGILHDTIEDTNTTYEEILENFNEDIANLVFQVTHVINEDGPTFPNLKMDKRVVVLKFADRLSNLSRIDCWSKSRQDQYLLRSKFWK